MQRDPAFARVISVFARYGYRKASMTDLAEAANVSRQTLYNRFGAKTAVLDWAVEGVSRESETLAVARLDDHTLPLSERIIGFFMEWMGVHTTALHNTPHGAEIFEMCKTSRKETLDASHDRCAFALSAALAEDARGQANNMTDDLAFVLIMASKGILTVSADEATYEAGVRRVVEASLRTRG